MNQTRPIRFLAFIAVAAAIMVGCSAEPPPPSSEYGERLSLAKKSYPFEEWKTYAPAMEQYTPQNCDRAAQIFDDLIRGLSQAGPNASESDKLEQFRIAIQALNKLNEGTYLIETFEREQLAELVNEITVLAGLKPSDYADGAGIADLWRYW